MNDTYHTFCILPHKILDPLNIYSVKIPVLLEVLFIKAKLNCITSSDLHVVLLNLGTTQTIKAVLVAEWLDTLSSIMCLVILSVATLIYI